MINSSLIRVATLYPYKAGDSLHLSKVKGLPYIKPAIVYTSIERVVANLSKVVVSDLSTTVVAILQN